MFTLPDLVPWLLGQFSLHALLVSFQSLQRLILDAFFPKDAMSGIAQLPDYIKQTVSLSVRLSIFTANIQRVGRHILAGNVYFFPLTKLSVKGGTFSRNSWSKRGSNWILWEMFYLLIVLNEICNPVTFGTCLNSILLHKTLKLKPTAECKCMWNIFAKHIFPCTINI